MIEAIVIYSKVLGLWQLAAIKPYEDARIMVNRFIRAGYEVEMSSVNGYEN
jgi:hypothetical protein